MVAAFDGDVTAPRQAPPSASPIGCEDRMSDAGS
jgi:hypothetical protein